MKEEASRNDASKKHKIACNKKLNVLLEQKIDLSKAIDLLLENISKGVKFMKVYKQMKMYNDEELNPVGEFSPISGLPGFKKYKFAVRGNPSLGSIKTLMVGVKNPSQKLGDELCGEVWFNELRIAGIDSQGGWAATGALDANLADFVNVAATAGMSTIGFGAIDQTPNQSNREDMKQYDVITNINAGHLLPEKWGVQIPLSLNVGETYITPEYDPFYQDILLENRLDASIRSSQRDSINQQAIDYTKRKSISLIGVRKITLVPVQPDFIALQILLVLMPTVRCRIMIMR